MTVQVATTSSRLQRATLTLAAIILTVPAFCDAAEPVLKANDLLRQAVANENIGAHDDYYSWTYRMQKPRGTLTKLMVETPEGIVGRTIAINDRALTADERKQDDDRNHRLLDPEKMREKVKKQQEDEQHIARLLHALPDAFQCEYAPAPNAQSLRLDCSPNPSFNPPNYESQVLQGMKTVIFIDREDRRISRIEATLFRDVSFGWGIIGKLNRGGYIEIDRSRVAGKHWGVTQLRMTFDGHVVVFKSVKIDQVETAWGYRPVPKMSVAQALDFLRDSPVPSSLESSTQHESPVAMPGSHESSLH
jgi:hypothetical protein